MKFNLNSHKYWIFIFLCLLFPRDPQIYTFLCTLSILFFLKNLKFKNDNVYSQTLIIFCCFVFISSTVRLVTSFNINIRDYLEVLRYLPIGLIFLSLKKWQIIKYEDFINASFAYLLLDGFVSYLQLQNKDFWGIKNFVKIVYNSEFHYSNSLGLAKRTLGLSTGPGDHAVIIFTLLIIIMCGFFLIKERKVMALIGMFLAFLILLSSQSRTVFIALLISTLTAFVVFFIKQSRKNKLLVRATFIIITVLGVAFLSKINEFLANYRYLNSLFVRGLELNSYLAREEKWSDFLEMTEQKLYWMPIGWGKDFFGASSGAMDGEYIYIYCVYGLLIFLLFILIICRYMIFNAYNLTKSSNLIKYKYTALLFTLIPGGLVVSFSSSFFTDQRISYLLALILTAQYWENKKKRLDTSLKGFKNFNPYMIPK